MSIKGILKQPDYAQSFQGGTQLREPLRPTDTSQNTNSKSLQFTQNLNQSRGLEVSQTQSNHTGILKRNSNYLPSQSQRRQSDNMGEKEKRIESDFQNAVEKERLRQEELSRHVVKDLGRDTYKLLRECYKEKKKLYERDPIILFDFWKMMNKQEKQGTKLEVVKPLTQKELRTFSSLEVSRHNVKERKYLLKKLALEHPDDILLTLTTHKRLEDEELLMQKEELQEQKEMKREYEKRRKQDKINEMKLNQQQRMEELTSTNVRAADGDEDGILEDNQIKMTKQEREKMEQKLQAEKNEVDQKMRDVFVETIIVLFKKRYPVQKVYKNRSDLMGFWLDEIPNRKELNLDLSEDDAQRYFDDYFFQKGLDFFYLRKAKIGYNTFEVDELLEFYLSIPKDEKKRRGIYFESEADVNSMIQYYLERASQERNKLENECQIQEEKRQEYFQKLEEKSLRGKEIAATDINTLAQPKDRLAIGKSLLHLRKQYPNDKILRKMILDEFQDNKIAKHPLEYDCKDEVNEAKIQHRELVEVRHAGKKNLSLTDLDEPLAQRTNVLVELFEDEIDNYYYHLEDRIHRRDQEKIQVNSQMKNLQNSIEQEAQRFIQLRKRRFTQKVPTINEFLSVLYREVLNSPDCCIAVKKNFPNFNHGESKRLKQRSYPYKFKRFFFEVVRSYAADMHKDAVRKLPFWAPSGKNYRTLNYKVKTHSKEEKMLKRYQKYQDSQTFNLWDNQKLEDEKLKVMMTFEEAKECRFEPMVGLRAPLEVKSVLKARQLEYGQTIQDILFSRKPNFEKWLDRMGPDFRIQHPKVYRFGIYKRCISLIELKKFRDAATLLFENFKVDQIRAEFNLQSKKSQKKETLMFSVENCATDQDKVKKLKDEDFSDQQERRFLEDVYFNIIRILDKIDQDLKKDKDIIQSALHKIDGGMDTFDKSLNNRFGEQTTAQDTKSQQQNKSNVSKSMEPKSVSSYDQRAQQAKTYMCPLKQDCPSTVKERWPKGNLSNSVPPGANCEYAHTYAELKFITEKKAKLRALTSRINLIQKQLSDASKPEIKSWNPANNILIKCTGCGPIGPCSVCQMRNTNIKKIQDLKLKSDAAYQRLSKTKSVQLKQEDKEKKYNSIQFKISSLQRADILFKKERFSEAFEIISKAAVFVKQELEQSDTVQEKFKNTWSQKLHAQEVRNITAEEVYQRQKEKNASQITLFASKTGIIGGHKPDTNEFLNYQVQLMYLKVEKALNQKKKDIQIMKTKIEKLEDEEEKKDKEEREPSADPKNKDKKVPGSLLNQKYADLVSTQRKIKNLQNAIEKTEEAMLLSKTPASWNPTSAKDSVLDLEKLNDKMMVQNLISTQNQFMKKTDAISRNTIQLGKSIYNRNESELISNPLFRESNNLAKNITN